MKSNAPATADARCALRDYRPVWIALALLALVQASYAAAFIWRSSLEIDGRRYFCLFDDAMISMRYADNWARGLGWVWNAGERVEGYTNFGWTLLLGLVHLFAPSPSASCLAVQLIGVPVLWGCLLATILLARACRVLPVVAIGALLLTALLYNLHYFTLLGMETGLLTMLVTLSLASSVQAIRGNSRAALIAIAWLLPALLVRSDVLVLAHLLAACLFLLAPHGRWQVLVGLACLAALIAVHSLWRWNYYGDTAPNTYYLKLTGWPLDRRLLAGMRHTLWTALQFGVPLLVAAAALFRPRRWHFLLLGCFATLVAYQVYCGGDAWPLNRFVLPAAPALFLVAADGAYRLARLFVAGARPVFALTAVGVLACLLASNAVKWERWLLLKTPDMTPDNRMNLRYHVGLEKLTSPEATVAVGYAGTLPYYSRRRCIDIYGKCEPNIARLPVTASNRPGHNKMDLEYVIRTYAPDVVLHAVFATDRPPYNAYEALAIPVDGGEQLIYRRRASPHVSGGRRVSQQEAVQMFTRMMAISTSE